MPAGRPSKYTEQLAEAICDYIATGMTLIDICEMTGFPSRITVNSWMRSNAEFLSRITRAREDQQDYFADRIHQLNMGMNAENWQFTNAQIRNIQWLMGKLKPKVYGEKAQVALTDGDGGPLVIKHIGSSGEDA